MTVVFAKNKFSGFRRAKHKHLLSESYPASRVRKIEGDSVRRVSESKPYSTTSFEHVTILPLGELLRLFYLCFCLVSIDRQRINKQIFFLSFTERIFFQSRRLWRVCNQPNRSVCFSVSRVTGILQLIKKQAISAAGCPCLFGTSEKKLVQI